MARTAPRTSPSLRTLAAALGLAALALLPACGGSTADDAGSKADTADGADSATPAADPLGERVVVLAEEPILADVLALGIEPVASTASVEEVGFQGLDDEDTSDIEILPMTTLGLEQVAALRPDTIITLQFWVDQVDEDQLRGSADLIILPDGLSGAERITDLGERTGRTEEAAQVVADLEAATEAAREAVPSDCAVTVAAIYSGPSPALFVEGIWEMPSSILATGCTLDPDATGLEPDQNGRVYLSLEELELLDGPTMVLMQSASVEGEDGALADIEENPLWATLPAVRDDRVLVFDRLGYPGATGQIRFLQEFAERLADLG